jgi:hypothetical protein
MSEIYVPRQYQDRMREFLMDTPDCALWAEPGMGKTSVVGTAMSDLLYDEWLVSRVLIVGPKRVASKVWFDEFRRWKHLNHMKPRLLTAQDFGLTPSFQMVDQYNERLETIVQRKKKGKLAFGFDFEDEQANRRAKAATKKRLQSYDERIHIVSWDFLEYLVDAYGVNWPYDMVVLDESSFVKDQDSNRFKACRDLRKYTGRIVELTGTPATNGLMNLWAQMWILDKGARLGQTITSYRQAFFYPEVTGKFGAVYKWGITDPCRQQIYDAVSDIAMPMQARDYLELPTFVDNPVYVELPDKARDLYDEVEAQLFAEIDKRDVTAATPAALVNKLLQIANGNVYDDNRKPVHVHDAKLDALRELADSSTSNLLVCYAFKPEQDAIAKTFGKRAIKLDSDEKMDAWNRGEIEIAYTHAASIGHGTNIQRGGNHIVWFGVTHNLELWQQMNARLIRSGQREDHVTVSCILAEDTLDKHVRYRVLDSKAAEQQDLMDAVRARRNEP